MKTDLQGRRLGGRYLLESVIASGGMATVWRGRDEVLRRPVAVKVLADHLAADRELFERFRLEAVAAARLSHPAVVRVFDTGVDGRACYIVMELFEGRTLAQRLASSGPLPPHEATGIARAVLGALAHAHAAGVVHRDVKPANVLIGDGLVKVTDFGIARAAFAAGDLTATGELLGTAAYLAPEQVAGADADHRSDLYAVGLLLYEMLTGRQPFHAETALETATLRLASQPLPPGAIRPEIPREVDLIVLRALARDPAERFQSAEEMARGLDRWAGVPGGPPPPPPPARRAPASRREFFRSWMLVPLVVLALAATAVVVGLLLGRLELGGPLGVRARPEEPALTALTITEVRDHDPQGDGIEHPERVGAAADGNPATTWETEGYNSAALGGIKDGVGIVLDFGASHEVREVVVTTTLPGWRFELMTSDDGVTFSAPLAAEDGSTSFRAGGRTEVRLEPARARYLLVWIVELAPEGDRYRADVAEVEVRGRP